MARQRPGPDSRPPSSADGGRPHHLSSVVHHFLSDTAGESSGGAGPVSVFVTGAGCPDLVARVAELLAADSGDERLLAAREAGGAYPHARPAPGVLLVWCAESSSGTGLGAVRDLGRWIGALRPAEVEFLVSGTEDPPGPAPDLGALRRRLDLVAPGVPVRIAQARGVRLDNALQEIARRSVELAGSGARP